MSKAIIKMEVTSKFGQNLFDKLIRKRTIKGIDRGNRISKKKGIDYIGEYSEDTSGDFSLVQIKLTGEPKEVEKDVKKIEKFLFEQIRYKKRTSFNLFEKLRKLSKEQVFKAYSITGINIMVEKNDGK